MILIIPDELKDEFHTFLEVGLASVTAYPDAQLTQKEQDLIHLLKSALATKAVNQEEKADGGLVTGICSFCSEVIYWNGEYWKHKHPRERRHSATP